ncbi:uroporphyrinogen-III C-methyltransferase [Psittacicella hinzii]|uniref:Uncharacterized protein n=1 Tax=Psittacicella hinzii TaxID=2028575 RepID=A0A3A1YI72_9GAMM|nr:uroporphyrinogen-III C-methyltransferase [Psittacicella hinzii]RIY37146.1 hypothetical protein CKF58_05170 [Psittacicella hinzii]
MSSRQNPTGFPFNGEEPKEKPVTEYKAENDQPPASQEQTPQTEDQTSSQQSSSQSRQQSGSNNNNNHNGPHVNASSIVVEPPRSRFMGLMLVLALGLSGFAVYKMYEPSIFSTQDLEATAKNYVTVSDFNTYKNSTSQDIEILKIKYNILQQQFDSRLNQASPQFDRTFGGTPAPANTNFGNFSNGSNGSTNNSTTGTTTNTSGTAQTATGTAATNAQGTTSDGNATGAVQPQVNADGTMPPPPMNMAQIVEQFVTYERLNQTLNDFRQNIETQINNLNAKIAALQATTGLTIDPNAQATGSTSSAANAQAGTANTKVANAANTAQATESKATADNSAIQASTTANNTGVNGLTSEQVATMFNQLIQAPEFKVYMGTLIAEYVAAHPQQLTAEQQQQIAASVAQQAAEQVLTQINANLPAQVEQAVTTHLGQANLDSLVENKINQVIPTVISENVNKAMDTAVNQAVTKATNDLNTQVGQQLNAAQEQINSRLGNLYAQVNLVLVQQSLQAVQAELNGNANLDKVLLGLRVAYAVAPNVELRAAIQEDYNVLAAGRIENNNAQVSSLLMAQVAKVNDLPQLSSDDLDKATNKAKQAQKESAFSKATKDFFAKFVQVQKAGSNATLPSENLNLYLKENLKMHFQAAIIAASINNTQDYRNALNLVAKTLTTLYPQNNKNVAALLGNVQELLKANLGYDTNYKLSSLQLLAQASESKDAQATTSQETTAASQDKASSKADEQTPANNPTPDANPESTPATTPSEPATPSDDEQPASPAKQD